jgi:hypothetical protein
VDCLAPEIQVSARLTDNLDPTPFRFLLRRLTLLESRGSFIFILPDKQCAPRDLGSRNMAINVEKDIVYDNKSICQEE